MAYNGVVDIEFKTDKEVAKWYETNQIDGFEPLINQYLVLTYNNKTIDVRRWDGNKYLLIKQNSLNSRQLGKVKPKDEYQMCLIDALLNDINNNNNIVLAKGKAGSGKSLFCLNYCFHALEKGIIDKIVIFSNPVVARNSAKLGFYPGTKDEKLLDSFLGNMLGSKLGDKAEVVNLISKGKLELLPVGDIRGYETGKNTILYLPEAQNYNIDLMKLVLQRVGDSTKVLIDGDVKSQVDLTAFEGDKNGMRRVSKIFAGQDVYFEVELKNIYRSRIGALADKM